MNDSGASAAIISEGCAWRKRAAGKSRQINAPGLPYGPGRLIVLFRVLHQLLHAQAGRVYGIFPLTLRNHFLHALPKA